MTPHNEIVKEHRQHGGPCRVCSGHAPDGEDHPAAGICTPCWYKILILVLIVMIAISYVVWFGIL
jgi:hypothetical protein